MKRHDGARFNGELKAIPYRIGTNPGALVTVRDVTERKKAEETLKESETKFRTLFETANDAIFLMDLRKAKQNSGHYSKQQMMRFF